MKRKNVCSKLYQNYNVVVILIFCDMDETKFKDCVQKIYETSADDDVDISQVDTLSTDNNKRSEDAIVSSSLLALLDDKNKSIETLKRQVHNQKVQLGYYLHRSLGSSKIVQLSETCIPQFTEENIHLGLALKDFLKREGTKSPIVNLHERMRNADRRLETMVDSQEKMMRNIVEKLFFVAREGSVQTMAKQLCNFLGNSCHVELFNKILQSTDQISKELELFRISCNRLLAIEDERNVLVEQVYSIPANQRANCSYMLNLQYEKSQLEQKVEEIKTDQKALRKHIAQFYYLEDNLIQNLSETEKDLINKTNEEINKYIKEYVQLKEHNSQLAEEAENLKDVEKEKEELEAKLMHLEIKYTSIINEIKRITDAAALEKEEEIHDLHLKLRTISDEVTILHSKLEHYELLKQEVKTHRKNFGQLEILRNERDHFKSQIEDLQAIRTAYAQLMEYCPVPSVHGDEPGFVDYQNLSNTVQDIQKQRDELAAEVATLNGALQNQNSQIRDLLTTIQKFGEPSSAELSWDQRQSAVIKARNCLTALDSRQYCTKAEEDVIAKQRDSKQANNCLSHLERGSCFDADLLENETQPSNLSGTSVDKSDIDIAIKETFKQIPEESELFNNFSDKLSTINEWSNSSERNIFSRNTDCGSSQSSTAKTVTPQQCRKRNVNSIKKSKVISKTCNAQKKVANQLESGYPNTTTTSFEVQATNQDGTKELMRAVLESSSAVKGVIKMDNSSSLSVKLECCPKECATKLNETAPSNHSVAQHPDTETASTEVTECELMRDCSNETVAVICSPVKRPNEIDKSKTCITVLKASLSHPARSDYQFTERQPQGVKITEITATEQAKSISKPTEVKNNARQNNNKSNTKLCTSADCCPKVTDRVHLDNSDLYGAPTRLEENDCLLDSVKVIYDTLFMDDMPSAQY